jgi:predicted nucleic acid-binding protein
VSEGSNGSEEWPRGAGCVCLDAMVLIHFNRCDLLSTLGNWFAPSAFTTEFIAQQEIGGPALKRHHENRKILDCSWLRSVPVVDPKDLALVADLRRLWGSQDTEDMGEAEVVALSRRYGWTAILDDDVGRTAAEQHGVPRVYMLTMMIAAAAHDLLTPKEAWAMHCTIESERRRAILTVEEVHRPAFLAAIDLFRRYHERIGSPKWPRLLAAPKLDGIVLYARKHH